VRAEPHAIDLPVIVAADVLPVGVVKDRAPSAVSEIAVGEPLAPASPTFRSSLMQAKIARPMSWASSAVRGQTPEARASNALR
jgi:hypothetical protein